MQLERMLFFMVGERWGLAQRLEAAVLRPALHLGILAVEREAEHGAAWETALM
jgi:hypothetical protein